MYRVEIRVQPLLCRNDEIHRDYVAVRCQADQESESDESWQSYDRQALGEETAF
jgi:hypothetical protein